MEIVVPEKFEKLLTGKYRSLVDTAVARYTDIYLNNKLEFFQDFTDHGIKHVNEVLEAAANIIDHDSYKYLNEKDVAVLIISILLHDVGMHISGGGMKKLLDSEYDSWRIADFDKKTWREEWASFFQEAKRFNDEQLVNIFGSSAQNITEPDLDSLDDYSRKLFGEFLRIHHHRLAHEIAHGGFPTVTGAKNVLIHSGDIDYEIIDVAGLIARSHGMPVRRSLDYLEVKFSDAWRAPFDIKAVFLMVVLRVADYLQIHSERASKIVLKSKRLASPVSVQEWEKHGSVKDINVKTADPERIFVIAKPENSLTFLELEKLFSDIQEELDVSWATLGEAYGRDEDLKNLKIKFRRIRSLLDNKIEFEKTIDYVPEKIFFNADPALLKLLIGPLYGEDPKYGMRELLQNAVDAVKEREFLKSQHGHITITLQAVKKDKPRYEIIIKDTGIGMSRDTIINYFFKAGASFRKSMVWKKNFIDDDEVKIQKTGRFGVGVLAVFLLGDEFEIWSRYDDAQSQGYYCKASLGMSQVELKKNDCAIGTTIKILLKDEANTLINLKLKEIENFKKSKKNYFETPPQLLPWFSWYVMDRPEVTYNIDENLKSAFSFIPRNLLVSSIADTPSKDWRTFTTKDYKAVHWIIDFPEASRFYYHPPQESLRYHNQLVCNGFAINRGYKFKDQSYHWIKPKISVFDNNANFPLSLSRDYVQDDFLPFEEVLLTSIVLEVINALLKTEFDKIGPYFIPRPNKLKFIGDIDLSEFIVVVGDEFTIMHPSVFSELQLSCFNQVWLKAQSPSFNGYDFISKMPYQAALISSDPITFYKSVLEAQSYQGNRYKNWFTLGLDSPNMSSARSDHFSRSYISSSKLTYLLHGKRMSKSFKDIIHKRVSKDWEEILSGKSGQFKTTIDVKGLDSTLYPLMIEHYVNSPNNPNDFFVKAWERLVNKEWTFPIEKSMRPEIRRKL